MFAPKDLVSFVYCNMSWILVSDGLLDFIVLQPLGTPPHNTTPLHS